MLGPYLREVGFLGESAGEWNDFPNNPTTDIRWGAQYELNKGIAEIPLSYFSLEDATFREGKGGEVTINRTGGTATAQTLRIQSSDGSATTADDDYAAIDTTISFSSGETSKTISVSTTADLNVEDDESFSIKISAEGSDAVPPQISDGTATVTIKADDFKRGNSLYTIGSMDPAGQRPKMRPKRLGGNLITINNSTENAYILNKFNGGQWIGFTDEGSEGSWKWSSGIPSTYTNFAKSRSQPSNSSHPDDGRTQNHAWIHPHFSGQWDDYWNDTQGGLGLMPETGIAEIPLNTSPTYSLSCNPSSPLKEGDSVRCNISTTNVNTDTRLYYSISDTGSGLDASDFSPASLQGSRLIDSSGNASFVLNTTKDRTTEGPESFNINLYTDYQRSQLVTALQSPSPIHPHFTHISISSSPSRINEGDSLNTTISTSNLAPGTRLHFSRPSQPQRQQRRLLLRL